MSSINSWAFCIACASVCTGLIRAVCIRNPKDSIIKTALTLYILLVIFLPLQKIEIDVDDFTEKEITIQQIDTQAIALANAQNNLQNEIRNLLQENNIMANVYITLNLVSNSVEIQTIKVVTDANETSEIKRIITDYLQFEAPIEIEKRDENNE